MPPAFGFRSGKYDSNLNNSYFLPIFINEREFEPVVFKKSNEKISCNFGVIQLLDLLNFFGGAPSLVWFLRAYETSEADKLFPYDWFDHLDKTQKQSFTRMMRFAVYCRAIISSKEKKRNISIC